MPIFGHTYSSLKCAGLHQALLILLIPTISHGWLTLTSPVSAELAIIYLSSDCARSIPPISSDLIPTPDPH